ncbi:MAG: hypothetical protein MUO25_10665 [Thermoanaerobaculaceae bacterium]|nr:hypothetical protein [Thermoanaerobaculaceae bacterium]
MDEIVVVQERTVVLDADVIASTDSPFKRAFYVREGMLNEAADAAGEECEGPAF